MAGLGVGGLSSRLFLWHETEWRTSMAAGGGGTGTVTGTVVNPEVYAASQLHCKGWWEEAGGTVPCWDSCLANFSL